ncbi:MAG: ABC transporter ATP-binding protein [Rhizobiaceae bacterium]
MNAPVPVLDTGSLPHDAGGGGRSAPLLSVSRLSAAFQARRVETPVLHEISFDVGERETVALVGESGSGKSVTALSIMRLLRNVRYGGRIQFDGRDLLSAPPSEMARLRGRRIAMIFQDPVMSLHPTMTVGKQIGDVLKRHRGLSGRDLRAEALRHLDMVRIANAATRYDAYPHQLSGGMCQRVMIATALACRPQLLIADEPTTALDVTVQAEILDLLRELKAQTGMATLFVTHDMGVVAELADRAVVMRHGRVVEEGSSRRVLTEPAQAYTQDLLASVPRLGSLKGTDRPQRFPVGGDEVASQTQPAATPVPSLETVLSVRGLSVRFGVRSGLFGRVTHNVHAVENVSFDIRKGETLGLVGESGSGKSTTGRAILRLVNPFAGEVWLNGKEVSRLDGADLRSARMAAQMIFQDPVASLNPQKRIRDSISEPLRAWGRSDGVDVRVDDLLQRVGLHASMGDRLPHEFSGGQRQRICIARALALSPRLIVADEAVSALDVSVKARICNLVIDLQREFGLACLFISHDMAVVERLSDRVAVMRFGEIVEIGPRRAIFETPRHPYTQALLAAVPNPDPNAARNPVAANPLPPGTALRPVGTPATTRAYREVSPGHLVLEDGTSST